MLDLDGCTGLGEDGRKGTNRNELIHPLKVIYHYSFYYHWYRQSYYEPGVNGGVGLAWSKQPLDE